VAGPNQIPGPTAIRSPTPDIKNHQTVLTQLKETTETAQRLRGNPNQSYVTLGELINAGIVKFLGGVISPGDNIGGGGGGGSGTVHVADSITGDGSTGTPLQLDGDSASPGNLKLYGTNGSGTKGWYTQPAATSPLTTKGDLYGHTTVDARIAVGSNGQVLTADSTAAPGVSWQTPGSVTPALPGTIPDLVCWFEFDNINSAAGKVQTGLFDRTPWRPGAAASLASSTAQISSTQLNSLNTVTFPAGSAFPLVPSFAMAGGGTYFVVINAASNSGNQAIVGGSANCMSLYLQTSGAANHIGLVNGSTAILTASTASWVVGTWFQANVTYNSATGAFAYRQVRAAANSGTTSTFTVTPCTFFASDNGTSTLSGAKIAAFIAYNRILSGTEITNVENYLFAKWGV